jgi:hypothetical protein
MPKSKAEQVKAVVPRRPVWANGDGQINRYLDRLEALEQRVASLEQALDTTIRRMAAIQAQFDTQTARRA